LAEDLSDLGVEVSPVTEATEALLVAEERVVTMRIRHDESGQVLVLAVLCMTVLLGFVALATDVGLLFRAKRNLQIAADAAVAAGALDYLYNASNVKAQAAAIAAAAQNGVTNGSGGAVVTVNVPPLYGYHKTAGYVEVIITQANPTFFMNIFNINSATVAARAVAGTPGFSNDCLYVLDPAAPDALELQGNFTLSTPNCGVIVDSSSPDALQFTGGAGTLTAGSVAVVGGAGGHTGDSTPAPVTGVAPVSDPFQGKYSDPAVCTYTTSVTSVKAGDAAATVGGVVCFTNAVTLNGPLTLASGTYVFENSVTLGGAITSGAGGTTFDLASGGLSINTNTTLNLVAPTSGYYNGVVLMEPPPNSSELAFQKGNSTGSLTGIIYAPDAELFLQDNAGGLAITSDVIVGTLYNKTSTLTIASYSAANPTTTPLKAVSLVE
jgi:Flp pilus assembly protein TadG